MKKIKSSLYRSVIANADNLIQEGNIDKAKAILSDAYAVTKSEEIQNKLNGLSGRKTSVRRNRHKWSVHQKRKTNRLVQGYTDMISS